MYVHWLIILVAIEEKSEPFSSKCSRHLAIYQNSNESNLYKIPLCDGLQWLPHAVQSVLNQYKKKAGLTADDNCPSLFVVFG